jgi:hypothetical protein
LQDKNSDLWQTKRNTRYKYKIFLAICGTYIPIYKDLKDQWFSTFFSSRHTKDQRKFGGTLIPNIFVKYFKKSIFSKKKKIGKIRNKKFGGTLGRSSRHTG